ncbi:MAG: polymer-forming cytoskeletal protein [Caulobacterales bacterium]|nr:polymer-forming cytoskeletal protein [Caulobacterales bacterium]
MFSRTNRPTAGPELAQAPRKPGVASLIAEGVQIKGDLASEGDIHLDGRLDGDLRAGSLTIGETGAVTGAIYADCVEVRGRVTGTLCARKVRLLATARVDGDISHTELAIEAGAQFEGRSLALVTPAAEAAAEPVLSVAAE